MLKTFKNIGVAILSGVLFTLTMVTVYAVQTGVGFDEAVGDLKLASSGALQTGTTAANTALLQAYDVDGSTYATFATLTANNTPTMDLASNVTSGGNTILTSGSTIGETQGGTDQTTYTLGDILYSDASNSLAKLAGNTTVTRKYLSQLGDGGASAAPSWEAVSPVEADTLADVTGRGATTATATIFEGNATLGKATGTTGALHFKGTTSGTVDLDVLDEAGTWSMTLPANDGDANQFLKTDGSGNTSWSAASSAYARSASKTVCVNTSIDAVNCDYIADGTADEVQIQAAIDAVTTTGGTVYLSEGTYLLDATLVPKANVRIVGSYYGSILKRTATSFSIFNTSAGANYFSLDNIRFDGNGGSASRLIAIDENSTYWRITNCYFGNTTYVMISGSASNMEFTNNVVNVTGGYTVFSSPSTNIFANNKIIVTNVANTVVFELDGGGIFKGNYITVSGTSGTIFNSNGDTHDEIVGNYLNGGTPCITMGGNFNNIIGNTITGCGTNAITVAGRENNISNNFFYLPSISTGAIINVNNSAASYNNYISGNVANGTGTYGYLVYEAGTSAYNNTFVNNVGIGASIAVAKVSNATSQAYGNIGSRSNHSTEVLFKTMKNTSGGSYALGDLVVLKSVAAGDEVTTSTTSGDSKVFGMATATITDTSYGQIQTLGKTASLKADGTLDIAIGDFLCQFTTAKIASKCLNGGTAIAIALEAYATDDSSGVLDAILIPPRPYLSGTPALAGANTDITSLGSISTVDINGGSVDGAAVGAASASTGAFTTLSATTNITCSSATDIGWSVVAGADTACNTTCTSACVIGFATDALGGSNPVGCADASADSCLCGGAS